MVVSAGPGVCARGPDQCTSRMCPRLGGIAALHGCACLRGDQTTRSFVQEPVGRERRGEPREYAYSHVSFWVAGRDARAVVCAEDAVRSLVLLIWRTRLPRQRHVQMFPNRLFHFIFAFRKYDCVQIRFNTSSLRLGEARPFIRATPRRCPTGRRERGQWRAPPVSPSTVRTLARSTVLVGPHRPRPNSHRRAEDDGTT